MNGARLYFERRALFRCPAFSVQCLIGLFGTLRRYSVSYLVIRCLIELLISPLLSAASFYWALVFISARLIRDDKNLDRHSL